MKGTGLMGVMLAAGLGLALPATASAQVYGRGGRGDYGRDGYANSRDYTFRAGFDNGYQDGLDHGNHDAQRREDFNFQHDKRYRDGDHGYRSSYGPRGRYIQGFRAGYETGYREAYQSLRYGSQGHRGGYGSYGRDGANRDGTYRDGTYRDGTYGRDGSYPDGYYRDRNGVLRDQYGRAVPDDRYYRGY